MPEKRHIAAKDGYTGVRTEKASGRRSAREVHVHTFFTYRDGGEGVVIHCNLLVEFDASECIRIAALYLFLLLFCC